MSQNRNKRAAEDSMEVEYDLPTGLEKSNIVRIDILSLNGKNFDHKFSGEDVKDLWEKGLKRDRLEIIGQSSNKISKTVLRVNIQLKSELSLKEISPTAEFTYHKSTIFQNYAYDCKVVGLGRMKEAEIGDTVVITIKRGHFRFDVKQAAAWIEHFGKIVGTPRLASFPNCTLCVCVQTSEPATWLLTKAVVRLFVDTFVTPFGLLILVPLLLKVAGFGNVLSIVCVFEIIICCLIDCWSESQIIRSHFWYCWYLWLAFSYSKPFFVQLGQGFGRSQHRINLHHARPERTHPRMATHVGLQGQGVLSRDEVAMQQLLAPGSSQQGLQGPEINLEGIRQFPMEEGNLRERAIREMVGSTSDKGHNARGRSEDHPRKRGRPKKASGCPQGNRQKTSRGTCKRQGATIEKRKGSSQSKKVKLNEK